MNNPIGAVMPTGA